MPCFSHADFFKSKTISTQHRHGSTGSFIHLFSILSSCVIVVLFSSKILNANNVIHPVALPNAPHCKERRNKRRALSSLKMYPDRNAVTHGIYNE